MLRRPAAKLHVLCTHTALCAQWLGCEAAHGHPVPAPPLSGACSYNALLHLLLRPLICGDCLPSFATQEQVAALFSTSAKRGTLHIRMQSEVGRGNFGSRPHTWMPLPCRTRHTPSWSSARWRRHPMQWLLMAWYWTAPTSRWEAPLGCCSTCAHSRATGATCNAPCC